MKTGGCSTGPAPRRSRRIGSNAKKVIVMDDCPYTDEEMLAVGTEISLAVCKAYKEVPGLSEGNYDRDAIFRSLVETGCEKGD